jgi:DNA-binding CsgD family transcriptional regulator
MPQHDQTLILSLIDKLYAAALDGTQWNAFLSSAAEAVGADHAFVCQLDLHRRSLSYVGLAQRNRDAVPTRRYGSLMADDPRRTIFDSRPGEASHCRMGLSDARLQSSRTYRNYLRPLNIEYTMVAVLPVRDGFSHDLGFTRSRARAAFRSDECALLNQLVPHLRRAFEISRVLEERAARTPAPPPSSPVPCDPLTIQTWFALSPTQARLAALLFDGKSLRDAAEELHITEGSARQYLKKVFEKTGASRQLDLIRKIEAALARNS